MARLASIFIVGYLAATAFAAGKGELEIRAVDSETGKPVAVRVHLKDARGKSIRPP